MCVCVCVCVCVIAGWEQKRPQTWSVSREECDAIHILHSSGWEVSERANPLHTRVIITRTTLYSMHMSLKYVNRRCTTRAVQTINTHLILPSSRGWCSQTRSISFKTDKMYYRRARRGKMQSTDCYFSGSVYIAVADSRRLSLSARKWWKRCHGRGRFLRAPIGWRRVARVGGWRDITLGLPAVIIDLIDTLVNCIGIYFTYLYFAAHRVFVKWILVVKR